MPRLFELLPRHIAGLVHSRWLLWLLTGLILPVQAQVSPQQMAQYQRRVRAVRFDHAYWDASHDSLRRVLVGQRADTLRLQTLDHLISLTDNAQDSLPELLRERREALALARRLHYPEQLPLSRLIAYDRLCQAPVPNLLAMRDTLLATLRAFEALGNRPQLYLLEAIRNTNIALNQPEANRIFFTQQLARYQRLGEPVNTATCYRALGNYYLSQGDANRGIGMRLRAAELLRTFSKLRYYNEIAVIGVSYVDWGNGAHALPYLRKAAAWPGLLSVNSRYVNRSIARVYYQQGRYALALHYDSLALSPRPGADGAVAAYDRALGLVQQSADLLGLGRVAAVQALLGRAQRLADSLHLPLYSRGGNCELHATWARYFASIGDARRAGPAWRAAYQQARRERRPALVLSYLRGLAGFCQQQGQPARAAAYGLAALALADTLEAAQVPTRVARYEFDQAAQAQQSRLVRLRRTQQRATAQARQQRTTLGGLLAGLAGLGGLAGLLWRTTRRQRHDNALLAQQQQQLTIQAKQLSELDAVKNQFFANASHELRTPLTLVLAPLETLLNNPTQKLPPAVRAPVALAHRQAGRLHELVNRILDLTRLQAGRMQVQPAPTAVAPWLRRTLAQFEPLAAARGLALYGPELLPEGLHLLLDADKVDQILLNLLSNALNHTPAGGAVTLTAAWPAADGLHTLTVRDTGPGIAPAEQERVFERFYQSPQNQAQGGTGLGLALSRELATLLGGTLTLDSTLGQGAAFTLRFPAVASIEKSDEQRKARAETVSMPAPRSLAADTLSAPTSSRVTLITKPRVLVVEDDPDLRAYLRELLTPTYEVLTATDGQDALEVLSREAPVDFITTDAMMPRLSGTELLARLKADPARAGVPVLMLTARADDAHRQAALTVGVDDYLTKPFTPAELLARVQVLLTRQEVRRHFAKLPANASSEFTLELDLLPGNPASLVAELPAHSLPVPLIVETPLAQWRQLVTAHLADQHFGPAELAGLLNLSERTLYRRLGELAGLTPAAWLRELRLDQARQLLEAGDFRSVAQVADATGFASVKYFSSCYAERYGRRPNDYRTPRQ